MGAWVKKKGIDLNASSADRWTTCTASPKYIFDNWDRLPPENRTYADEGNTAHEVAAALLQGRKVNPKECPVPVTAEMNWNGWQYMEFVEGLIEPRGRVIVEQRLPLFYAESRNAIVDAAIINNHSLHVVDYKYGEGVIVSPENNLQATIYAKSVVWASTQWNKDKYGIPHPLSIPENFPVTVHIYQPRSRNADESPFHSWATTWGDIDAKARKVFNTAANILHVTDPINPKANNLVFAPSEKACQFCPAKGFCEARPAMLTQDLPMLDLTETSPPKLALPQVISMKQLAAVVKYGDQLKKWIDDANAYALQFMRAGHKIPGFKLVDSRGGKRFWSDPKKAAKYLLEDSILREDEILSEPKLNSPAQIEKLLGKGKIPSRAFHLISKPPGSPVIVSEDDPRANSLINGADEFEDLDATNTESTGQRAKVNLDQF